MVNVCDRKPLIQVHQWIGESNCTGRQIKDGGGECTSFDLAVYPLASPVVRTLSDCLY